MGRKIVPSCPKTTGERSSIACCLQFRQNESMKRELLSTAGTALLYADLHDTLLGIGVNMHDHQNVVQYKRWPGHNVLGQVLTDIRDGILSKLQVLSLSI